MKQIILILLICFLSCKSKELEKTTYNVRNSNYKVYRDYNKYGKLHKFSANNVIFSDERKPSFSSFVLYYDYKNRLEQIILQEYDTNFYNQKNLDTLRKVTKAPDTLINLEKGIFFKNKRVEFIVDYSKRGGLIVKNGYMYQMNKKGILKGVYLFRNDSLRQIIMSDTKLFLQMKEKFKIYIDSSFKG